MQKSKLFKFALATSMATAAVVAVVPADAEAAKSFSDLDATNPHYPSVMNLTERGIINGYPDGTFRPYEPINRGHAAKILAQALGLDTKNVKDPGFKDIPKSFPYYGEIAALANVGIINGYPDGTYRYNQPLTRGQMAKIIANAYELKGDTKNLPFTDVAISPYKEQIAALFDNKVTVGSTPTTFKPLASVTRGQLASFVVRAEAATAAVEDTIVEIKDGKVITKSGTYEITEELKKVFNEANAEALKDAKVEIVIDEVKSASLASLNNFANVKTGKIKGIKALTLVSSYTKFDAGGYKIPSVTIEANGVEVSNLKADTITIGEEVDVTLNKVEVDELEVKEGAELTLDKDSKIDQLVVPEGTDIEDVVSNYDEVKDAINDVVDSSGNTVDKPGTSEPPAGGGGGGGGPTNYKPDMDKAIKDLFADDEVANIFQPFGQVSVNGNKITVEVTDKTFDDVLKEWKKVELKTNVNGFVKKRNVFNRVSKFKIERGIMCEDSADLVDLLDSVYTYVEKSVVLWDLYEKELSDYTDILDMKFIVEFKNGTKATYEVDFTK